MRHASPENLDGSLKAWELLTQDTMINKMNETQICPLALALNIIGDRWTLLVVRDLLQGKSRYNEFSHSDENIPTNILANRLKRLLEQGLVEKTAYQQRPVRYQYHLTAKGAGLLPAIQQLAQWSQQHYPQCKNIPAEFFQLTVKQALQRQRSEP